MKNVILFGASSFGCILYSFLKKFYDISYFCDNDSNKWGTELNGIKVISPNELKNSAETMIIITSTYYEEISKQLISLGINEFKIVYLHGEGGYNIIDIKEVLDEEGNIDLDQVKDGFTICDLTKSLLIPKNKYIISKRCNIQESSRMDQVAIDNLVDSWDTFWGTESFVDLYFSEKRKKSYEQICNLVSKEFVPGKIIDIGCGSGEFIKMLQEKNLPNTLYGTDFSSESIKWCKRRIKRVYFAVDDIFKLSFGNNEFENVICMEVLEHLQDPTKALREIYRITKINGRIIITIPNGKIDNYLGHINFWSDVEFSGFISETLGTNLHVVSHALGKFSVFIIKK